MDPNIVLTPSDDPEMDAARKLARKTFKFFWRELSWEYRRIIPGLSIAAVKAEFTDPPEMKSNAPDALEVEHMWINEVEFDGLRVSGTLINSPNSLRSVSEGDAVQIAPSRVGDWMYAIGDDVYGGYSVDLMRQRMGGSERKQHDAAWGLNFGDVGIVHVVPPDYIGEKQAGGFLSKFRKPKQQPQDIEKAAATEHPMSVNMRQSLEETLRENPAYISEPDDKGFTFLHQLSLAGSYDGVDVLVQHGADVNQPAKNGLKPLRLARSLGWKKVMNRLQQAGATE